MPTVPCPECRHVVPAGRWCNRCGAVLVEVAAPSAAWGRWRRPVAAGVLVGLGVLGVVLGVGGDPGPTRSEGRTTVVLDGDPPTPPPGRLATRAPATPSGPAVDRVEVVCSDLQRHHVPVTEVSTTEPGAVVDLVHGPCVVMDPEARTDP